jgi:hypothetical protein
LNFEKDGYLDKKKSFSVEKSHRSTNLIAAGKLSTRTWKSPEEIRSPSQFGAGRRSEQSPSMLTRQQISLESRGRRAAGQKSSDVTRIEPSASSTLLPVTNLLRLARGAARFPACGFHSVSEGDVAALSYQSLASTSVRHQRMNLNQKTSGWHTI